MKSLAAEVGRRVRWIRESMGLTREQFCDYVDISVDFLSEIERGVKGMSVETLKKVCEGLSVSADDLVFGKKKEDGTGDVFELVELLLNVDPRYLPLAEEHIRTFIKTIGVKNSEKDA